MVVIGADDVLARPAGLKMELVDVDGGMLDAAAAAAAAKPGSVFRGEAAADLAVAGGVGESSLSASWTEPELLASTPGRGSLVDDVVVVGA